MKSISSELAPRFFPVIQKVFNAPSLFFRTNIEPILRRMKKTFEDEFLRELVIPLTVVCLVLSIFCSVLWTKGMGNRSVSFVSTAYAGKPEVMKIPRRQFGKPHTKTKSDIKPEIVSAISSLIALLVFASLLLVMFWGKSGKSFGVILVSLSAICALATTAGQVAAVFRPNMTAVFLSIVLAAVGLSVYFMKRWIDSSMTDKVSLALLGEFLLVYLVSFTASLPYL